jgi:hypothetical protein
VTSPPSFRRISCTGQPYFRQTRIGCRPVLYQQKHRGSTLCRTKQRLRLEADLECHALNEQSNRDMLGPVFTLTSFSLVLAGARSSPYAMTWKPLLQHANLFVEWVELGQGHRDPIGSHNGKNKILLMPIPL